MNKEGQFRCIYCGDYFDLTKEEMEVFLEGYLANYPDTCDNCNNMLNHPIFEDEFSDADPGL